MERQRKDGQKQQQRQAQLSNNNETTTEGSRRSSNNKTDRVNDTIKKTATKKIMINEHRHHMPERYVN